MQNKDLKKIENQGWKEMQQMLDQELPVDKSKRRIIPWFWFSSIAAIFVLAAMIFSMNQNTNLQIDQPIASDKTTDVTADADTKVNEEENFETSVEKEITNRTIASQKETIDDDVKPEQKEGIFNIEITNPISTEVNEPIQNQITTNSIDQKIINQYENFKSENLSITCPSPSVPPTVKTSETFENLEKLPSQYADLVYDFNKKPITKSAISKTITPLKERKAKAQWAMNLGTLSARQPRVHGGSTGIEFQFPVSKKWSIQTGLNYRIVNLKKVFVNVANAQKAINTAEDNIDVGFGNDTIGTSGLSSLELDASTFNNRTQTFEFRISDNYHFVSIPIEAHLQIKSHGLWVGAETSYLLNADQQSSTADLSWGAQHNGNDPNFSYNNQSTPSVPRFDLGFTVGYEYNFNQKVSLNLSYHHGNLIQQNDWHLDNRFFKLGANYKL